MLKTVVGKYDAADSDAGFDLEKINKQTKKQNEAQIEKHILDILESPQCRIIKRDDRPEEYRLHGLYPAQRPGKPDYIVSGTAILDGAGLDFTPRVTPRFVKHIHKWIAEAYGDDLVSRVTDLSGRMTFHIKNSGNIKS